MGEPDLSRRRFFGQLLKKGAQTASESVAQAIDAALPERVRPPGAVDELAFLARCTACNDCVEACPEHAIFTLHPSTARGANTPVMVTDERACVMCEGFPCASACETGALQVPDGPTVRLGSVRVDPAHCFTFKGPECGACVGLCPGGLSAISLRLTRPVIDEDACVGCGICIASCPTTPKAIVLRHKGDDVG